MKVVKNLLRSKLTASNVRVLKLIKKVYPAENVMELDYLVLRVSETSWKLLKKKLKRSALTHSATYTKSIYLRNRQTNKLKNMKVSHAMVVKLVQLLEFVICVQFAMTSIFVKNVKLKVSILNMHYLRLENLVKHLQNLFVNTKIKILTCHKDYLLNQQLMRLNQ